MPYGYAGTCYATTGEALESFQKSFPKLGDVNWTSHVSSSINTTGQITYSVQIRPITSNTLSSRTGSFQLAGCSVVDAESPFDPAVASGIFVFFFASIVTVWVVSKNAGLILEAVKRW